MSIVRISPRGELAASGPARAAAAITVRVAGTIWQLVWRFLGKPKHQRRAAAHDLVYDVADQNVAQRPLANHLWNRDALVRWKAAGYPPARQFEAQLRRAR